MRNLQVIEVVCYQPFVEMELIQVPASSLNCKLEAVPSLTLPWRKLER